MLETREAFSKEQRRARRYSVNFPCEIRPGRGPSEKIFTRTRDVSCGGLYFSMPRKWEAGERVEFLLHLPLKATGTPVAVRCHGKVARIVGQENQRFGVGATIEGFEFIHLNSKESQTGKMKAALARSARAIPWLVSQFHAR